MRGEADNAPAECCGGYRTYDTRVASIAMRISRPLCGEVELLQVVRQGEDILQTPAATVANAASDHVGGRSNRTVEATRGFVRLGNVKLKTTDPFFSLLDMDEGCCSVQLIDGDGVFNVTGIEHFMKTMKLVECGLSYAVVSIMGPQSSGIAYEFLELVTLVNFSELDREEYSFEPFVWDQLQGDGWFQRKARHKLLKAFGWQNALTLNHSQLSWIWRALMEERERRGMDLNIAMPMFMDDTAFEKQSALLALAVSDIMLINMWCHDIGREQAANKPLLKTVFQVMMRLFSPRKTTLLFVIRDKTRIWDNVPKPQAHKETPLSEFFNVEVTALSSYEEKEELFKEQVRYHVAE
ncbi:hypothetical protein C4D60_Mb07t03440 [Musa balbisiana]|uniref:GB1/RHD3-type G domain-containing protein n=1 Tax=Musa balbisiana TaxID=52838 RepID=A0A4S8JD56_MUSBA|nr:hypothetical protein C4D60_Mb07t03440 [Musa balbisiana]